MNKIFTILDTTLRDGEQGEGIAFTLRDKLAITELLDKLGIHYIEGGWPGSNPKAEEYFKSIQKLKLNQTKIAAFGSTRHINNKTKDDPNLQALLKANTNTCVIFGKAWDFHVTHALRVSLENNLELISDSIKFLKAHKKEVIFDAEHFFDGYKNNPKYALKTLAAAAEAGADILCLCDTNGGSLPSEIGEITKLVVSKFEIPIGNHSHNDSGLGVANTIAAVENGATHIQGTLNGYGERCGNANLSSIIPILALKKNIPCINKSQLKTLAKVCHHIDEIANLAPKKDQPFVGLSAFAHKGGVHVSAVLKHPETYEHIVPSLVGNKQRVLVSELAGGSNIKYKAKEFGLDIDPKSPEMQTLLKNIKTLENSGYQFEGAEASFELMMQKSLKRYKPLIKLERFRVLNERRGEDTTVIEATIKAIVKGQEVHIAAEGNGPVSALDHALRKSLEPIFPELQEVKLIDYKVRVLDSKECTGAKVRVLITSTDGHTTWGTVGVSENIIEASWQALVDSFEYKLMKK